MKKALAFLALILVTSSLYSQWMEMSVLLNESVWASSSLSETIRGRLITYGPEALFDGDLSFPWVEGSPESGIGESVTILTNRPINGFSLTNGFAGSPSLFQIYNRLKEMDLSLLIGFTAPGLVSETDYYLYFLQEIEAGLSVSVKDSSASQSFDFQLTTEEQRDLCRKVFQDFAVDHPMLIKMILDEIGLTEDNYDNPENLYLIMELYGFLALRLTIRDVYEGSRYNDTCLAEMKFDLDEF
ncbi:hypothetical protein [Oceanispirochaeta sp.]|jgi:hypothetical protein|uniref:NADase-type glycan-binding domain-containing protein n=1 Tax=Oceanispirochaeta sp. TaxID=2035350 RepID=UPI00261288F8|nr:hypothetical protein [Oceanispirochaeta sp.]MDA3955447.1 hypothetical protein [Oceanispirochaeta sp.]